MAKFADAKKEMAALQERKVGRQSPGHHHGVFCFVPANPQQEKVYNAETISLCQGICPDCGDEIVEVEIDKGKVFYTCANRYHFYVRDAME